MGYDHLSKYNCLCLCSPNTDAIPNPTAKLTRVNLPIQASKCKQYVVLPISFAGGIVENFQADSATTSKEIIDTMTRKIGLKEKFGFSIFIAIFHKVNYCVNTYH